MGLNMIWKTDTLLIIPVLMLELLQVILCKKDSVSSQESFLRNTGEYFGQQIPFL